MSSPLPFPPIVSLDDRVPLNNGTTMPRLGLGTYRSAPGNPTEREVGFGIREVGYRGIDTAKLYGNEADVSQAVRAAGVPREELFIATKLWNDDQGYEAALAAFDASLARLEMDYVDLYLVHWPNPRLMRPTWRAMEEIYGSGRAKAIGVCNHLVHHLEELCSIAEVQPAVDQVEHHPRLQQPALREFCRANSIVLQAWAPIIRGRVFQIPELVAIGDYHGKTAAQVAIRWILQHDVTTIPKSVHEDRLRENADIFDFELSGPEMAAIDTLDLHERIGPDPDRYGI